jgi:hypothetical protein
MTALLSQAGQKDEWVRVRAACPFYYVYGTIKVVPLQNVD